MVDGIYTQLSIGGSATCPITAISEESTVTSVTRTTEGDGADDTTVEFTLQEADDEFDSDKITPVFEHESETVYRLSCDSDDDCPCNCIEEYCCPIRDTHVEQGRIVLSFICPDVATLQSIVHALKTNYDSVTVRQLARTAPQDDASTPVLLDRDTLTDRQHEVLQTAHELGYFDHPKRANAGDVAGELDISTPTFVEHLSAAQSKLLEPLVDGG
jgi:predicted DNA binding protein